MENYFLNILFMYYILYIFIAGPRQAFDPDILSPFDIVVKGDKSSDKFLTFSLPFFYYIELNVSYCCSLSLQIAEVSEKLFVPQWCCIKDCRIYLLRCYINIF